MTAVSTATKKLTLEEYLAYDDGTDTKYKLVDEELDILEVGHKKDSSYLISLKLSDRILNGGSDRTFWKCFSDLLLFLD
ncbi:hypothetical protein NIES2100_63140 [Calothrix sp. NIES-2100]|nr:hypothetical protein NIES2100_63140 [Calothrix sp. NIES-2100]